MIFCSIDLAISTTGICIYDTSKNIPLHCCKISTKYGIISKESEAQRIAYVLDEIFKIMAIYKTKTIVVEDQFIGSITSKKTSMILSRVRGALEYGAIKNKMLVTSISNTTIKKKICEIAGIKSDRSKETVAKAVLVIYPNNEIVNSIGPYSDNQSKKKTSDIYDALALAVVYASKG